MRESSRDLVSLVSPAIEDVRDAVRRLEERRLPATPAGRADDVRRSLSQELGELAGLRARAPEVTKDVTKATRQGLAALRELGTAVACAQLKAEIERSALKGPAVHRTSAARIWRLEGERYRSRVSNAPVGCREFHAMQAYYAGVRDFLRAEVLKPTAGNVGFRPCSQLRAEGDGEVAV